MICGNSKISRRSYVALTLLCIIASLFCQACNDRRESFYPSLADAIKSGEITRGWTPDFLPASSRTIHVIYRVESPRTWCAFEFPPDDPQRLRTVLITSVHKLPALVRNVDSPNMSWWPDFLFGDLEAERIYRHGFNLYIIEEPRTIDQTSLLLFAIDWVKGRGFFYRSTSQ
jgi:hypothetical protein